ncbi:InlB B-repeat-containing protein, partial [Lacrimispora defluvii]
MKKRKRSRIPSRTLYCFQKRLLAFLLAAAMILANVGADTNQVYAASSSESVTFSVGGSQLIKAIEDAIVNGNEVTAEDLDFTNGKIAEFKELFFGKGKIYEAFPELEGEGVDAQLRVFVRIPENADDMYMVTGDEEIVFLYVNNGENTISCSTEITRMDDGVEKVKKTNRITVRSYESAFGKEEVNVVTKPEQPTVTGETKVPETATPAKDEKAVETAPVKETTAAEETVSAPEETTAAPETPSKLPEETITAPAESQTEAPAEETVKEAAESEEIPVPESKVSEPVASIIRHNAPVVAAKENGGVTEASEISEETAAVDPENVRESKETEASTKAETTQVETIQAETTQVETTQAETVQAEIPKAESTQAETSQVETTQPETTQAPAESQSSSAGKNTAGDTTKVASETASPSESKPVPETPASETKASPAGTADLVGMGYCSTAKAYTVTINQLKALEDYDGYKISYTINPEASARIIEGPRGVEEGQELTFGVKNQIGYAIESVTANGQILKSDSATDNTDGSQTTWYSVPEIYEDQEVEVHMSETGEHPEFSSELVMEDGTIIRLHAPEGVLPAGVKASAVVVTGIGDAVKDKVEAQAKANGEAKEVISSLSYNIDLLDRSGNKLDNQIWNGSVQVTFSGTAMENHSKKADSVEVVYVATTKEEEPLADVTAADVTSVEPVSEELSVQENKGVNEITFEAEHFSTYTIIFNKIIGSLSVPLNIVKYDSGNAVSIGTNATRNTAFWYDTPVSITDITPTVSGYTFEKATIGKNYVSGDVIQSLEYKRTDFLMYTLKYKTSSSDWLNVGNNGIYLWYSENGITVQFNANGGQGSVASKIAKPGETIDLPDGSTLTRPDYRFMGWSESPDGGKITAKGNAGYNEVYTDTFTIKANETVKPKTLYAIWAQTGGKATGRLWIAVLNDGGDLPAEPRNQDNRNYVFIYTDKDRPYKTIGNSDNLLNYINPLITVTGKDNVQENLKDKFYQVTAKWIKENLNSNQYIEWYVIKYESDACGTEGWHVDGIIRNNKSFYVDYAGNENTGGLTPDGHEYTLNTDVTVAEAGGYESGIWIPLKKDGYVFNGWNTKPDGSGEAFNEGSSFKLTQEFINANHSATANTVTLYAQWKLKNSVQINYRAVGGGKVSLSSENLNPDFGVSKGSTATADNGYKFSGWYRDTECNDLASASNNFTPERPVDGWVDGTTFYAKFVVDENQTLNYKIKYFYNNTEDAGAEENKRVLVADPTVNEVPLKDKVGYKLSDKPYSPQLPTVITGENNVINVYYDSAEVHYAVNAYYQVNGEYAEQPTYSYIRNGYTESVAELAEEDWKVKKLGYVFDEAKENVLSGVIAGDGSLILKIYFKQQFTVTYTPGTQGTFESQNVKGLDYNAATPEFNGTPTGKPGYVFTGWSPTLEPTVIADVNYEAQWSLKDNVKINFQAVG